MKWHVHQKIPSSLLLPSIEHSLSLHHSNFGMTWAFVLPHSNYCLEQWKRITFQSYFSAGRVPWSSHGPTGTREGVSARLVLFPSVAVPNYPALMYLSEYILRQLNQLLVKIYPFRLCVSGHRKQGRKDCKEATWAQIWEGTESKKESRKEAIFWGTDEKVD